MAEAVNGPRPAIHPSFAGLGVASPGAAGPSLVSQVPDAPCLADYLSQDPEARLRDLLAFAMAVEQARPVDAGAMRQKAEAELQAHAFRTMHNQVETIRLEAAREQLLRVRRAPGGFAVLLINLVALALGAGIGLLAFAHRAEWLPLLPPWMMP